MLCVFSIYCIDYFSTIIIFGCTIITTDRTSHTLTKDLTSHTLTKDLTSHTLTKDLTSHTLTKDLTSHTLTKDLTSHTLTKDLTSHTLTKARMTLCTVKGQKPLRRPGNGGGQYNILTKEQTGLYKFVHTWRSYWTSQYLT
jgi:hypothetical protein